MEHVQHWRRLAGVVAVAIAAPALAGGAAEAQTGVPGGRPAPEPEPIEVGWLPLPPTAGNVLQAGGTLTTTIDGRVYRQPANGT